MFRPNVDHDIFAIEGSKIIPDQSLLCVSVVNHVTLHQLQRWLTVNILQNWQQLSVRYFKELGDGVVKNLIDSNFVSKLVMENHQNNVRGYSGSKSS